jgi:hypothetical protein
LIECIKVAEPDVDLCKAKSFKTTARKTFRESSDQDLIRNSFHDIPATVLASFLLRRRILDEFKVPVDVAALKNSIRDWITQTNEAKPSTSFH